MQYQKYSQINLLAALCLAVMLIVTLSLTTQAGLATAQNKTISTKHNEIKSQITNATKINIVLVHGAGADASSWSKVIPILLNAGHKVIAVQLRPHSLADDISTVKRAIDLLAGPTILV